MKKQKLFWCLGLLLILIVIVSIFIFIFRDNTDYSQFGDDPETYKEMISQQDNKVREVESITDYYIIKTCINKFFKFCEYATRESDDVYNEFLYSLLSDEYIEKYEITKGNISEKLRISEKNYVSIKDVYLITCSKSVYNYVVYGKVKYTDSKDVLDFKIMIQVDRVNKTFCIFLDNYLKDKGYDNIKYGDEIVIQTPDTIENRKCNMYTYKLISQEEYVQDLFNTFKSEAMKNIDILYLKLSEESKNKYPTYDSFKNHISSMMKQIVNMEYGYYVAETINNKTQYTCYDSNNSFKVVFIEKSPGQCEIFIE